jgi:hypothetical protein
LNERSDKLISGLQLLEREIDGKDRRRDSGFPPGIHLLARVVEHPLSERHAERTIAGEQITRLRIVEVSLIIANIALPDIVSHDH